MSDLMDMARKTIGKGPPKREGTSYQVRKRVDALIATVERVLKDAERIGVAGRNCRVPHEDIKNLEYALRMLEDIR